jgi:hypothetical protein
MNRKVNSLKSLEPLRIYSHLVPREDREESVLELVAIE